MEKKKIIVTGALGYSGKFIAKKLIEEVHTLKTLTNSAHKHNPFGEKLIIEPFHFENPDEKLL